MSDDQESSVVTIGKKASEEPDRTGTARVWTSSSDSECSKSAPERGAITGGAEEGPATGTSWTAGKPKADCTFDKNAGN